MFFASLRLHQAIALAALTLGAAMSTGCGGGTNPAAWILGGKWGYFCAAPKQVGQFCSVQEECVAGTFCDLGKKQCSSAWVTIGSPCNANSNNCKDGYCKSKPMVGTCHKETCNNDGSCLVGASLGTSCDPSVQPSTCGANATCVGSWPQQSTCTAKKGLDQPCDDNSNCKAGLMCHLSLSVCKVPTPVGGKCRIRESCAEGLYCLDANKQVADAGDMTEKGTCQPHPHLPAGAPCMGDVCAKGLHCDYSVNKCAKDYAMGAWCSQGNECGEFKSVQANCIQGSCAASTSAGAKCYPGENQRCPAGLVCASEP